MSKLVDYLTILAWNVYIGNTAAVIREALKERIDMYHPEIIALMEATRLYDNLHKLGYQQIQLKPRKLRPNTQPEDSNIVLLVRNDIEIVKSFVMRMTEFWSGPKHGWPHDPRVYRWVRVKYNGEIWKIGAAHVPFGEKARAETVRRLVQWFRNVLPGRPTVLVLDANMRLGEFRDRVAQPGEARASGTGIDLEAHKHCRIVNMEELPKGPSDHPGKLYDFTRRARSRRKAA